MRAMDIVIGAAAGSWLTVVAYSLGGWLRARKLRRLNAARAKAMVDAINRFFNEPTPGCDCPACHEKRSAAPAGAN